MKRQEWMNIYKRRISILMMCCVTRVESKLSLAAEKNLNICLKDFEFSAKIYASLEGILDAKTITDEDFYFKTSVVKLFKILYKNNADQEKIKRIYESTVESVKLVEVAVKQSSECPQILNHCRFVYEMVNIFTSVDWFSDSSDNFMRSFDRKVFDIATKMHRIVSKIP